MPLDPNARLVAGDIWSDPSMGHQWVITGLDLKGARVHLKGHNTSGTQNIAIADFVSTFTFVRYGKN